MFTFDNISLDRILVPVDGSNQSKEALRRAAFIARQFDASITLLSVVEFGKVMSGVQQVPAAICRNTLPQALKKC